MRNVTATDASPDHRRGTAFSRGLAITAVGIVTAATLAVTLSAAGAPPVLAQAPSTDTPATVPDASTWTRIVDHYASGRFTDAAAELASLDAAAIIGRARSDLDRWRDDDADTSPARLRASAAIALELAIMHVPAANESASERYLALGEAALRGLDRSERGDLPFVALWRLAQLQYLLVSRQLADVERAARRVDLDRLSPTHQADLHLARGIVHESAARLALGGDAARVQQTPFGTAPMNRDLWIERGRRTALAHYRAAVAADDTHREAQLRLGRVLLEMGVPAEARTHLQRAAVNDCLEPACGLGWLFLGEWQAAHGSPADTRRAYLQASRVLDVRQSALVGLLMVTQRERPAAALEMTRQFDARAMLGRQPGADGWSRYLSGYPLGLTRIISDLRAAVQR